jgi:UDP-N-acetylbacillosamine N-acetyltransferase
MGSTLQNVIVWGASGHALVVADILRLMGNYEILGYLDDVSPQRKGESFGGASIVGGRSELEGLIRRGVNRLALGVGDCEVRLKLAALAVESGFTLVTAMHPSAIVAPSARVGAGSVLCAGSVVNPEARLGIAVIVNTCASVDHECVIGDGVHLSPGTHLAGNVTVGRGTTVGIGSVARDGIRIGEGCVIGAGAVIVGDLPDHVVAYGVPARAVRSTHDRNERV